MKLKEEELRKLYQEQTAHPEHQRVSCLDSETLLWASTGELSQPERERMVDHLITCSHCAEEYRLVRSLQPWAEQVAATEVVIQPPPRKEERVERPRDSWWRRLTAVAPARLSYAMAAVFLIVSLALGAWIVILQQGQQQLVARLNDQLEKKDEAMAAATGSLEAARRQLEEARRRSGRDETEIAKLRQSYETQIVDLRQRVNQLSQPQLNIPIIDLDPQRDPARGGSHGGTQTIRIPAEANSFTVILNVAGEPAYPNYALELTNQRGNIVWRGQGLRKSAYNTFSVGLSRLLLPAGQYQIKLYGLRGQQKGLVEEYAVRVAYQ